MIQNILKALIGKKKLVGWISAAIIAVAALLMGEPVAELKDVICAAPVVEIPQEIKDKVEAVKPKE